MPPCKCAYVRMSKFVYEKNSISISVFQKTLRILLISQNISLRRLKKSNESIALKMVLKLQLLRKKFHGFSKFLIYITFP